MLTPSMRLLAVTLLALPACASDISPTGPRGGPIDGGGVAPPVDATIDATTASGPSDLPCDVAETLAARCWTCHGTPPAGPRATEAEIAALEAWIAAGAPAGACDARDPFDTPVQCTSTRTWSDDADEGPEMHPGRACITCHSMERDGPDLWLGGTVYPSAHEPDDCLGASGGDTIVEITDADGRVFELVPNASGNFLLEDEAEANEDYVAPFTTNFRYPYRARVLHDGRERAMATPQTSGDCNACHTVEGANGAPGRILLP